jgi:pyridoxal phosphate enzyme (YggS family)
MIIKGYDTDELKANFERVRSLISEAAAKSPSKKSPTLLAATKTVPVEVINYAAEHFGLTDIGENRVQELMEKYDYLDPRLRVHFIGNLQRNKVKYLIGRTVMIHSVDNSELAAEISRRSLNAGIVTDVLVEINIAEEASKSGVPPSEALFFAESIMKYEGIRVRGFMTMAPAGLSDKEYHKYFNKTYRIFIDFSAKKSDNVREPVLSMGMSGSFIAAIEEGSTVVRIGTALFGRRRCDI